MDIVITSPSLDPRQNVSGISTVVSLIIRHNSENQYFPFTLGKRDTESRGIRWFARTAWSYVQWFRVLLTERHRLIHFNMAIDMRALMRDVPLIIAARLMRRRVVLHVHGGRSLTRLPTSRWMARMVRSSLRGSPTIVQSADERTLLQRTVQARSIVVLPNCVDLHDASLFHRRPRESGPLTILFLGRIAPGKGLELIVHALEQLRRSGRPLRFILAGAGPDEAPYVRLFYELLDDAFEFRGVVRGNAKSAVLRESDVFLLPSAFEGLPMALLESMSYGLVPIVTDVGSIPLVVRDGENGIVLKSHSADAIVNAIERLDGDRRLVDRLSRNARDFIFSNHDPHAYVKRLNEIYGHE